jgi:hypothetical protein
MANKRDLKKQINAMIVDVIDECIYIQETKEKKSDAAEALIEEVIAVYNDLLERINRAKNKGDFKSIIQDFEEKSDTFLDKLNSLNQ